MFCVSVFVHMWVEGKQPCWTSCLLLFSLTSCCLHPLTVSPPYHYVSKEQSLICDNITADADAECFVCWNSFSILGHRVLQIQPQHLISLCDLWASAEHKICFRIAQKLHLINIFTINYSVNYNVNQLFGYAACKMLKMLITHKNRIKK